MSLPDLLDQTIQQALAEAAAKRMAIYTFALYFDHESSAVSVCLDTEENSARRVIETNAYNNKYFLPAVANGDLSAAAMWTSNIGRNLSLGGFALVNAARITIDEKTRQAQQFFLSLVQAVVRNQEAIESQAVPRDRLILCCSGANDEVEFVWSATRPRV